MYQVLQSGFWVFVFFGACLYMLPFVIANARHSQYQGYIFTINLLLGWTLLGWFAALLWGCTEKTGQPRASRHDWIARFEGMMAPSATVETWRTARAELVTSYSGEYNIPDAVVRASNAAFLRLSAPADAALPTG